MITFKIEGLKELEKEFENSIKKAPKEYEKLKKDIKDLAFKNTAKYVPADQGRLRGSFEKKPWNAKKEWVEGDFNKGVFMIGTKVWYAHMIDKGHVTVDGKGFVKGVNFMEKGLEETAKAIPKMKEEMLERVLSGFL